MLRKPDFITARAYLADRMTPVETERVSLSEAAGRILAEDLIAADNIPPFDRSPFDGYAFRAADTAQHVPNQHDGGERDDRDDDEAPGPRRHQLGIDLDAGKRSGRRVGALQHGHDRSVHECPRSARAAHSLE